MLSLHISILPHQLSRCYNNSSSSSINYSNGSMDWHPNQGVLHVVPQVVPLCVQSLLVHSLPWGFPLGAPVSSPSPTKHVL